MNTTELLSELQKLGIPNHWFLIGDKGISDDKICLRLIDDKWAVYYSERGDKFEVKTFETEEEACRELLFRMKSKKERRE